jgi:hypothetical protein
MATVWKQWKSNGRIPTVSTASWKSREGSEIPTFPQLLRFVIVPPSKPRAEELGAVEKWKSKNRIPTFPPHRKACGAKEENPKSVYNAPGTFCIPCVGLDTHSCERL